MTRLTAVAVALAVAAPAPAPAQPPPLDLRLDLPLSLGLTGGALSGVLASLLLEGELAPGSCRICGSNGLDTAARDALLWRNTGAASRASDALLLGVPLAAGGLLLATSFSAGGARTAAEDALMVGEAVSVVLLANQVAKYTFGRVRPYAWADGGPAQGSEAYLSLWSAHTSATFATATAAATVARLRGYPVWPWILGVGLAGAATCGWLRVAADKHWATDVLAGAAVGSLVGVGLPLLLHGRADGDRARAGRVAVVPWPVGLAGTF